RAPPDRVSRDHLIVDRAQRSLGRLGTGGIAFLPSGREGPNERRRRSGAGDRRRDRTVIGPGANIDTHVGIVNLFAQPRRSRLSIARRAWRFGDGGGRIVAIESGRPAMGAAGGTVGDGGQGDAGGADAAG